MEFAVEVDIFDDLGAVGLEGGAEVVQVNAAEIFHESICDEGWDAANPEIIDAASPPAGDDIVALIDFPEETGNFLRGVLKIGVHGDDDFSASGVETGGQGGRLAEIPAKDDQLDAAIIRCDIFDDLDGAISASIVDEDDFVSAIQFFQNGGQPFVKFRQCVFLVEDRQNDGELKGRILFAIYIAAGGSRSGVRSGRS